MITAVLLHVTLRKNDDRKDHFFFFSSNKILGQLNFIPDTEEKEIDKNC